MLRRLTILCAAGLWLVGAGISPAQETPGAMEPMMHHDMDHSMQDGRTSLGLPPQMKQHQLANMRSHLVAVQAILNSIAEGDFEQAAQTAHAKLGLTEEMKNMCNMFENDDFRTLGFAFHESGDALGDVLETGDTTQSLQAIQATMGYCVQCHASFRQ